MGMILKKGARTIERCGVSFLSGGLRKLAKSGIRAALPDAALLAALRPKNGARGAN
jgi:hypothetical protein